MDTLHIRHLQHRSHLRGAATGAVRERVDSALTSLLDNELDAAMLAAGVDLDEEICLRRLQVRGQLNLSRSDRQMATDLSLAWVQALRQTIERGGPDVVRYRSRLHALCDMALGVSSRDGDRVWAWRQLGLCSESFDIAADSAVASLIDALSVNVTSVIPVLTTLADRNRLAPLLERMQPDHYVALAAAGLESLQLSPQLLSESLEPEIDRRESESSVSTQGASIVISAIARSPFRVSFAPHVQRSSRAIALLVLMAAEPLMLKNTEARAHIQIAIRILRDIAAGSPPQNGAYEISPDGSTESSRRQAVRTQRTDADIDSEGSDSIDAADTRSNNEAHRSSIEIRATDANVSNEEAQRDAASDAKRESSDTRPIVETKSFRTEWGGLMFLLSLVEDCGILESVELDPHLQVRGLRWALHRLAFALLPLSPDDPAACAFAGIHPAKVGTAFSHSAPSVAETRALEDLVERLIAALRERLSEAGVDEDSYTGSAERLLHTVCRRAAGLSMDPGWIEVRLPIDTASTEIRKSGLDRDPDWLPWLGAVVRFIYE